MLSDVVRVLRSSIRGLLALVVDLNRSQLLESNRSLNRLSHRLINDDLNNNLTVSRLRSKGLLALTQNGLAVLLGNQLSEQGVFLTRNQVLVGNTVVDLRTSNNLGCTVSKVSIRRNLRLTRLITRLTRSSRLRRLLTRLIRRGGLRRLLTRLIRSRGLTRVIRGRGLTRLTRSGRLTRLTRSGGLTRIIRGSLLARLTRSRGLTGLVTRLVRSRRLRRLGGLLSRLRSRGLRRLLTRLIRSRGLTRVIRGRGLTRLTRSGRLTRLTRSGGLTRIIRGSLLARLRRGRGLASLVIRLLRCGGLRRLLLGGHSLILIVDVLVLSDVIRVLRISIWSLLAFLVNLNRSQLLESNRSLNRLRHRLINSDLNNNLTLGSLRSKGLLTLTQNGLTVLLGNQLSEQGVFLTRNKPLKRHGIVNLRTSNNLGRTLSEVGLCGNPRPTGQTWLVRRHYTLGSSIRVFPWDDNSNEVLIRLARNIENLTEDWNFIIDNLKTGSLSKLLGITSKSRKVRNARVRLTIARRRSCNSLRCFKPVRIACTY